MFKLCPVDFLTVTKLRFKFFNDVTYHFSEDVYYYTQEILKKAEKKRWLANHRPLVVQRKP
ncbi:hypothetical protein NQ318_016828 [Aromia moschata]|uniref:Uncharacterized protein n=1 Tax=Aromia moschata TaxID=1265417 RepID=A0AAV8YTN5_9CUCU|nr:hypothetical protein NQ318_016828 [Aromia moschata]